ncbi:MAG: GAF domain-containing protein [Polyangiaceae bacterium]|nr:GAF domain-containing protein [Polyangiaceae bacterium]
MAAPSPPHARVLLAHRNALVALAQQVARDQTGAVLSTALEVLVPVVGAVGGLAYRARAEGLVLVSDHGVPRKAKPWLAHLPSGDERWFVAQRVAQSLRYEVEDLGQPAAQEHASRVALLQGGWRVLAAAPIVVGRKLLGLLVVAAGDKAAFDPDTRLLLDSACSIVGLALARERELERERDERLHETRTAQLATIGLVASTVAGELASPLAGLELQIEEQLALVEVLRRRHGPDDEELAELHALTGDIAAGTHRMQDVVHRLLALSRESALETLELGAVVEGSVELARRSLAARGLTVELRRAGAPCFIAGRAENLHMLVLQLLLYAAQECEVERLRAPCIVVELRHEGDRLLLSVESPAHTEVRPQAFDAFYLPGRRAEGRGPSFDLAVAKQIVLSHNGHIEVGAKDRRAPHLRVVLPAASAGARSARRISSKPPRSLPPVGPLPLVVWIDDDEPFVRSVRRCLKAADTRTAASLGEGRRLLAELEQTPAYVFCAVALPDGSGLDLHRDVAPQLARRFVFLVDGVMPAEVASYLTASGCPTLIRPIGLDEVSALLDGAADPERRPVAAPTLSVPPTAEPSTDPPARPSEPRAASARRRPTPAPTTPSPSSASVRARAERPTAPQRPRAVVDEGGTPRFGTESDSWPEPDGSAAAVTPVAPSSHGAHPVTQRSADDDAPTPPARARRPPRDERHIPTVPPPRGGRRG